MGSIEGKLDEEEKRRKRKSGPKDCPREKKCKTGATKGINKRKQRTLWGQDIGPFLNLKRVVLDASHILLIKLLLNYFILHPIFLIFSYNLIHL